MKGHWKCLYLGIVNSLDINSSSMVWSDNNDPLWTRRKTQHTKFDIQTKYIFSVLTLIKFPYAWKPEISWPWWLNGCLHGGRINRILYIPESSGKRQAVHQDVMNITNHIIKGQTSLNCTSADLPFVNSTWCEYEQQPWIKLIAYLIYCPESQLSDFTISG